MPEHTITITITSDHTTEELVDDALYGATIGEISPT